MRIQEEDKRFCVKKSGLRRAGLGLFAKRSLAQGAVLKVLGVRVRAGSVSDRCTRYADTHKFRVGRDLLIPFGYAGLVNHSERPNLEKVVKGREVFMRTLRPIRRSEELFFSYDEYAQRRFGFGVGARKISGRRIVKGDQQPV